jgi:selenocysteine-specific elongation factor
MIVATAGHVDHGKTRLVHALTGIDTDRLPEEQRRGMTIEAGFAHADFGVAGEPVGFVDVPGHERFVRNMLAGVAAIDFALVVVAADDGPMPQTREHLAVLDLLGVAQGAVALTKIDRVDAARLRQVEREVGALLAASALAGAPLFAVSTLSGAGIAALREHLAAAQRGLPSRAAAGRFRYVVDRVFTRPGAGLVVTGTVLSGRACIGDELRVTPSGAPLRVRGIQRHGEAVAEARAGQRCALNVAAAGGERVEVERGDWIVAPVLHAPTVRIDTELRLLADLAQPLAAGATLQLHLGAAVRNARATPLQGRRLDAGAQGFVQLVLDAPVHALRGDRFVLRDAAAQRLVGGGRVIDPFAPARGRTRPGRLADLDALANDDAPAALVQLLAAHPEGVEWPPFALARNLDDAAAEALRAALPAASIAHPGGVRLVAAAHWQALLARIDAVLADWHEQHPDSLGLGEAALLAACGVTRTTAPLRRAALRQRIDEGLVVRDGFVLRLATHVARLAPEDEARLRELKSVLRPYGLRPPAVGEIAPLLGLDLPTTAAFVQRAAQLGHLVQVAKNRVFLPATVEALVQAARDTAAAAPDGRFGAASFRDRSAIGRNLSIQVLEFFDRSGITHYAGGTRTMADRGGERS